MDSSFRRCCFAFVALTLLTFIPALVGQSLPAFTQVIVFGDSLSDDGNIRNRLEDQYFISYPGGDYNYSDGRFTNSSDTDPASDMYAGTWHEQLARDFLGLPAPTNSLDGGTDYAFGGATTGAFTRNAWARPPVSSRNCRAPAIVESMSRTPKLRLGATAVPFAKSFQESMKTQSAPPP